MSMKNKVIFLGDTILNEEPLGIQRFAYEIIKYIDTNSEKVEKEMELLIPENAVCRLKLDNIKIVRYGQGSGFHWRQSKFHHYVKKNNAIGVDMTLGLSFFGSDVVALFDNIYESFPNDFIGFKAKLKRLSYLIRAKINVILAKKIITISHYSMDELKKYYKIPNDKLKIIGCGWDHFSKIVPDLTILEKYNLESGAYCFTLGSSLPHKNLDWIINAALQNPNIIFVVTGTSRLSKYQNLLNTDAVNNIIFTGYLTDSEIKSLMSNCKVFILPSYLEGFGIPPMEALSCGAKVLVSNRACLPEIYKQSVYYLDPDEKSIDIEELIEGDLEDSSTILNKYTWKNSGEKMINLLNEI